MSDAIDRGRRVAQWLDDEDVKWVIEEAQKANYKLFLAAQTDTERLSAQARAQAWLTFTDSLLALVASGEFEQGKREQQEQNATVR